jgi:hypothetical protein
MSKKQRAANRRNGRKGGPRTDQGKAISSLNSTRHAMTSKKLVLNAEDEAEFQAMLDGYMESINPQGLEEIDLVRELVAGKWRQERYWSVETAIIDLGQDDAEPEIAEKYIDLAPIARTAYAFSKQHGTLKALDLVGRYEGRMRHLHERARRDLTRLQAARTPKQPNLPKHPTETRTAVIPQPAPTPRPEQIQPISINSFITKEERARLNPKLSEPGFDLNLPETPPYEDEN